MNELPLRDIHLPDPISWWPLAIGWWIVLGCVILFSILAACLAKRFLKSTLRKEAAKELDKIEMMFQKTEDTSQCVSALSALLRRAAISQKDNGKKAAGLTGRKWLERLDQPLDKPEFSQGIGQLLITAPYQPSIDKESAAQLIELCRKWVNIL